MKKRSHDSKWCFYLLFVLITGFSSSAFAGDYYLSPTGSDSNPGTIDRPWLTPQNAASRAVPGDTIIFKDGTYNVTRNIRFATRANAANPITFKAQNLHQAKIIHPTTSGSDATIMIGVWNGNGWTRHQEMFLVFDGLDIQGGLRHVIQSAGGGQLVIKNCKLHSSGNDIMKINSGADNVLIENNEIYDSGVEDSCAAYSGCNSEGLDVTSSNNVTVRNNHIHDILSWGVYTKKGSEFTIIENNLIHDIGESGIGLGESQVTYNSIARNNVLYNIVDTCLQASGAKESGFYHNTCYNVSTGNNSVTWSGMRVVPAQEEAGARVGDDKYSRNVELKNNIIVLNNSSGRCFNTSNPTFGRTDNNHAGHLPLLKLDNNLCYNLQTGGSYSWKFEGRILTGIDNWRSYTANLGTPQSVNAIFGDPAFISTDPTNPNFLKLSAGSIAVDVGANVSTYTTSTYDHLVRPDVNSVDLGAYEYNASQVATLFINSHSNGFIINRGNYTSFAMSGVATPASTVLIKVNGTTKGTTTATAGGTWSISNIDFTGVTEGDVNVLAESAGNTSPGLTGRLDITPPANPQSVIIIQ